MSETTGCNDIITTNTDRYILPDCGKKLLEVLINPEHIGKTITEKCQIAGVSRDTYYRLIKEDGFVDILNEASVDMIKAHVSDILAATLKFSLKDPKCHSDRKMLLQRCGIVDREVDGNFMIVKFED